MLYIKVLYKSRNNREIYLQANVQSVGQPMSSVIFICVGVHLALVGLANTLG